MNSSHNQPSKEPGKPDSGNFGDDPWRAMGLIGAVGVDLAVCLGVGYWLGGKADQAAGTEYYSIVGLAAGLAVGIISVIFLIRMFVGGNAKS